MKILLICGPLDGHTVEVSNDAQMNFISPQDKHKYVRALPGVFISTAIPQRHWLEAVADKLRYGAELVNRVGMAKTQLEDAAMYLEPTGSLTDAEKAVRRAQEILD